MLRLKFKFSTQIINFASIFSAIRHEFSTLCWLKFYMLSAKGVFPSTNYVKFHVSKVRHFALSWPFLLSKSYNVSAKKVQKSYISWYWRPMQSFLKKLTRGFKYDMRNLVSFHATTQKFEIFFLMGSFCPKYIRFEL